MTVFSTVLSNLASNVSAVMLFLKFIPGLDNPKLYWLCLAMPSTLALGIGMLMLTVR